MCQQAYGFNRSPWSILLLLVDTYVLVTWPVQQPYSDRNAQNKTTIHHFGVLLLSFGLFVLALWFRCVWGEHTLMNYSVHIRWSGDCNWRRTQLFYIWGRITSFNLRFLWLYGRASSEHVLYTYNLKKENSNILDILIYSASSVNVDTTQRSPTMEWPFLTLLSGVKTWQKVCLLTESLLSSDVQLCCSWILAIQKKNKK
jgi:hypothetical protein